MENVETVKEIVISTPKGFSISFINALKQYMSNNHYELLDKVVTYKKRVVIKFTYRYDNFKSLQDKFESMYVADRSKVL